MIRLGIPADKQESRLATDAAEGEKVQSAMRGVNTSRQVILSRRYC
jgi:hypothetical protein